MRFTKSAVFGVVTVMTAVVTVTALAQTTASTVQTPAAAPAPPSIQTGFGAGSYRPGGTVTWPVATQMPKPQYTDEALKQRIEGIVELEAVVLRDGTVGPVRITKSLDAQYGLDNEAIRAARQWVFKPGQLRGASVAVVVPMQLEFRSRTAASTVPKDVGRLRPLADTFAEGAYLPAGAGILAPRVTREVKPTYTPDGMRAKIQGQVEIEIIVMPDGTVGKARVVRSLDESSGLDPRFGLDQSALAAAKGWKFIPGTLDGKPVPMLVTVTLEFKLRPTPGGMAAR